MKWNAYEVVQRVRQEWEKYEENRLARNRQKREGRKAGSVTRLKPEVIPSSVIINVAAETQSYNGHIGIGWRIQKEDGGIVLAEAMRGHADHYGSFAELQAIQLAL